MPDLPTSSNVPTIKAPTSRTVPLFNRLTDADWCMTAVIICTGILSWALLRLGFIGGVILTAFLWLWLMWPLDWSRRYYAWGEAFYGLWIRFVLGGVLWESHASPEETSRLRIRQQLLARLRPSKPFPYVVNGAHGIGLVSSRGGKVSTILIQSDGSDISTLSLEEQYARQRTIANTIMRIAAYEGIRAEVGFIIRRRPGGSVELEDSFRLNAQPDAFLPAALPMVREATPYVDLQKLPEQGRELARAFRGAALELETAERMYRERKLTATELRNIRLHATLVESRIEVDQRGSDTSMMALVTIRNSALFKAAQRGKRQLSEKDAYDLQVTRLAREIQNGLRAASVAAPHILTPRECEDYIEGATNVVTLDDYQRERNQETSYQLGGTRYQPQHSIRVGSQSCGIDSTGIAVLEITMLPDEIEPDQMALLFAEADVAWLSRAIVGEASTGTSEYRFSFAGAALFDNLLDSFGIDRISQKLKLRRESLAENEERIARQKHVTYFRILMATANADPEQLESDVEEIKRVANANGCRAIRVKGSSRQQRLALTATTGIPA